MPNVVDEPKILVGRCDHGVPVAVATVRTEHLQEARDWEDDGLVVTVESEFPADFGDCPDCGDGGSDA